MSPPQGQRRQQISLAIEKAAGSFPQSFSALPGGCVAEVYRVDLADGTSLVAKVADKGGLAIEGRMLAYLKAETSLPVPAILAADDHLLLMDYIANDNLPGERAEAMAAEQLAALHRIEAPAFGFPWDTVIGALPQPNTWSDDWRAFFRDQRLMTMGRIAEASGRISGDLLARLERFCERLEEFLDPPAKASLIHGDVWRGNVLFRGGEVAAYIDPAVYFAPAEVEFAYIELLSTFGQAFFRRYQEIAPIDPGYWELRRDIYSLFPLLVHCEICGAPYPQQVAAILDRFG